jgi:hypothetical protein
MGHDLHPDFNCSKAEFFSLLPQNMGQLDWQLGQFGINRLR